MLVTNPKDVFNPNSLTFDERLKQLELQTEEEREKREKEKQSPYLRWAQFNIEKAKDLISLNLHHPKASAIFTFLVEHMDGYNSVVCSYKVLEEALELAPATIARAIKVLKEKEFIKIFKSGTSNIYAINHDIYWKSWGNNKRYSKFAANVVISESEQEKHAQQENHEQMTLEGIDKVEYNKYREVIVKK